MYTYRIEKDCRIYKVNKFVKHCNVSICIGEFVKRKSAKQYIKQCKENDNANKD